MSAKRDNNNNVKVKTYATDNAKGGANELPAPLHKAKNCTISDHLNLNKCPSKICQGLLTDSLYDLLKCGWKGIVHTQNCRFGYLCIPKAGMQVVCGPCPQGRAVSVKANETSW